MKKAFFFDKDGTLVDDIYRHDQEHGEKIDCAPVNKDELKLYPSSKDVVEFVKGKEFLPIVITNQPDFIKRDLFLRDYEEMMKIFCEQLDLRRSQVFECLHKEGIGLDCDCRKPKTGLILMAKGVHDLDLENSWYVGDSWRDIEAAKKAGVGKTIFISRKFIEEKQKGNESHIMRMEEKNIKPDFIIESIKEVLDMF